MTATMMPNSQTLSEWVKVFATQGTENHSSSVKFMKQMTAVAISTITYLKSIFPEENYKLENFEGIQLRVLKKNCNNEHAQFICTALKHAFEAFNKRYLHQLALCFYEDEHKIENLVEYHIFEYSYSGDGITMNMHSKSRDSGAASATYAFSSVKERTVQMIRTCVVLMQSCQSEMPPVYTISLRLYYNEDAPMDYQAPGFESADEGEDHLEPSLASAIRLGWVHTPYHRLTARSYFKDYYMRAAASPEAIAPQPALRPGGAGGAGGGAESGAAVVPEGAGAEAAVRCCCNKCDEQPALLVCQYCQTRQHAACYGVWPEQAALLARHCCAACHAAAPAARRATDPRLAALSHKQREVCTRWTRSNIM